MILISDISQLQQQVLAWKNEGKRIGFVPTMGALHQGHLSLMAQSLSQTDVTVVSIFVNPTQFGPTEDLSRYPRPIEADKAMLDAAGVTCLFLPSEQSLYPRSPKATTRIEVPGFSRLWCGKSRRHHFRGVTMIVNRLLNIVKPDFLFLGEKDYQQLVIVKTMVQDLFMPVEVVGCSIVRETDGLAMSSRNQYLSGKERVLAPSIYQALQGALKTFQEGERSTSSLLYQASSLLKRVSDVELEYLALIDPETLKPQSKARLHDRLIFAGRLGKTRLIDNIALIGPLRIS